MPGSSLWPRGDAGLRVTERCPEDQRRAEEEGSWFRRYVYQIFTCGLGPLVLGARYVRREAVLPGVGRVDMSHAAPIGSASARFSCSRTTDAFGLARGFPALRSRAEAVALFASASRLLPRGRSRAGPLGRDPAQCSSRRRMRLGWAVRRVPVVGRPGRSRWSSPPRCGGRRRRGRRGTGRHRR